MKTRLETLLCLALASLGGCGFVNLEVSEKQAEANAILTNQSTGVAAESEFLAHGWTEPMLSVIDYGLDHPEDLAVSCFASRVRRLGGEVIGCFAVDRQDRIVWRVVRDATYW